MEYRGYKIENGVSQNYRGEEGEYWYCKMSELRSITTNTFDDLKHFIDREIDYAIQNSEAAEITHKAMLKWYE